MPMTADTPPRKDTGIVLRSWLPARDDDRIKKYFTFACLSTPPILGSVSSFVLNLGALAGLLRVCLGTVRLSRDRGMVCLSIALYGYCTAYVASFALNPVVVGDWRHLFPILTFLLFPFLYSTWRMSRKETIARTAVIASMVACYSAFVLAAVQFHFYGLRAEGGAGNAIVFATVTCLAASLALAGMFTADRVFAAPLFGAFVAGSMALLFSGSRVTWVALFLSSAAILYVYRRNVRARISGWSAVIAALAAGAVTIVGIDTVPPRVGALVRDWQQLSLHGNFDSSLGLRAGLWEIGFGAVRDSPIIGHGPQFTRRLIEQGFHDKMGMDAQFGHFHNGFLTAWVETGLFGAVSLAAVFVIAATTAVRTLARSGDPIERLGAITLVVLVTTYMVNGLTAIVVGHDILDSVLMTFLVVGTFLSCGTSGLDGRTEAASVALASANRSPQNAQVETDRT
jgi:O-antigen ligase